jgi:hypothetical protein
MGDGMYGIAGIRPEIIKPVLLLECFFPYGLRIDVNESPPAITAAGMLLLRI